MATQNTIQKPQTDKSYQVFFVSLICFTSIILLCITPFTGMSRYGTIYDTILDFILSFIALPVLLLYLAYVIINLKNILYLRTLTNPMIVLNVGFMSWAPLILLLVWIFGYTGDAEGALALAVTMYYMALFPIIAFVSFIIGASQDISYCSMKKEN